MGHANIQCRGFDRADQWGHRAPEPNKAVICSLALAKLRTDIRGDLSNNNSVGMAQKLLLFWRKPARRCWWEGIELDDVEGVEGPVKVWIRRVWTLEMVRPPSPVDLKLMIANPIAECYWASLIFFPPFFFPLHVRLSFPRPCALKFRLLFFSRVAFKYVCNKYSSFSILPTAAPAYSFLSVYSFSSLIGKFFLEYQLVWL